MANDIVQTIAEARVDARSLSEFVFKPAGFKVARRLAPTVDTLQFYINRFNSLNGDFSSSVSVALSSLNNSVAEADGKVAYIESTVQDAINNTAVEGGVLADTFVTMTKKSADAIARNLRDVKNEVLSILDFCKCDGTDESSRALSAVQFANSRKMSLKIPSGYEVLIDRDTMLEPKYGLFGGGRIRKLETSWTPLKGAILLNSPNAWVDNIIIVTSDTHMQELDSIPQSVNIVAKNAAIEVTKNAIDYRITNCTIVAGWTGIWVYGGKGGFITGNTITKCRLFGIGFGSNPDNFRPESVSGITENTTVSHNTISHISSIAFDRDTGDGIKLESKTKNTFISHNNIHNCQRDCIDAFASGEMVYISYNHLHHSSRGIDCKNGLGSLVSEYGNNNRVIIEGNMIHNNSFKGIVVSSSGGIPYMTVIKGNIVFEHTSDGIWFNGSKGQIVDNVVYANATAGEAYRSGIQLVKSSNHDAETGIGNLTEQVLVSRNLCVNNGGGDLNTAKNNAGICLSSGAINVRIVDNQCYNVTHPDIINGGNQHLGIALTSASNAVVTGNMCRDNSVQDIWWSAVYAKFQADQMVLPAITLSEGRNYLGNFRADFLAVCFELQGSAFTGTPTNYFEYQLFALSPDNTAIDLSPKYSTLTDPITVFGVEKYLQPKKIPAGSVLYMIVSYKGGVVEIPSKITTNIGIKYVTY